MLPRQHNVHAIAPTLGIATLQKPLDFAKIIKKRGSSSALSGESRAEMFYNDLSIAIDRRLEGVNRTGGKLEIGSNTALFTRCLGPKGNRCAGPPSEFVLFPQMVWDDDFARMATPTEQVFRTAGRDVLSPSLDRIEGAWIVRQEGDFAYLTNIHTVSTGSDHPATYFGRPEDRPDYVEQATVRFSRVDWANYAVPLFFAFRSWLQNVARQTDDFSALTPPVFQVPPSHEEIWSSPTHHFASPARSTILIDVDDIGRPRFPFVNLIENLTPEERYSISLCHGFKQRVPDIDIQVSEDTFISFGAAMRAAGFSTDPEDPKAIRKREAAAISCRQAKHSLSTLFDCAMETFPTLGSDAHDVLNRVRSQATDDQLAGMSPKSILAAVLICEQAYALSFECKQHQVEVRNVFLAVLCAALQASGNFSSKHWEAISWLEFSPALIASRELQNHHVHSEKLLSNLWLIFNWDRELWARLTARMPLPDTAMFGNWVQVMKSSQTRRARVRAKERENGWRVALSPEIPYGSQPSL